MAFTEEIAIAQRKAVTYSAKVTQALKKLPEVTVYFCLLVHLLVSENQVFGHGEQAFRAFSRVRDIFGRQQRRASAFNAAGLDFMKAHTVELSPGMESLWWK